MRRAFMGGFVFPTTPFGLFARGGGTSTSTDKYSFAQGVTAPGTSLPAGDYYACSAIGNLTWAMLLPGSTSNAAYNNRSIHYTYADDTNAIGASLNIANREMASAFGNSTQGIFASGLNDMVSTSTVLTTTSKYTYASSTFAAGGSITAVARGACLSTSLYGYVVAGSNSAFAARTASSKYTHSNNTSAASTSLGTARDGQPVGINNTTVGIIAGGYAPSATATTQKWTFSNNTVAAGTDITINGAGMSGAGDATIGVVAGGYGTGASVNTSVYTYSNNTTASGSVLKTGTSDGCGVSSAPGGW